jgi:peptidylprolyl isomerase
MAKAKNGDTVKVHYTGKMDDGKVFDTSMDREPIEFKLGSNQVIPGFENSIIGMEVGEKKNVEIASNDAYGKYRSELVLQIPKAQIPAEVETKVGDKLQMKSDKGDTLVVVITKVNEDGITIDGNHPLAGKDLQFELEVMEIN